MAVVVPDDNDVAEFAGTPEGVQVPAAYQSVVIDRGI
jgi:hypothetical protein